ncbi:MAG: Lrp/AsnC family transcriptional regulator [Chloroflexota bacterium]
MPGALDATDLELIRLLQHDGRQSSQMLGRQLGVHASTIQRRIKRMVDEGILEILAAIEPARAGLHVGAAIGLRIEPGKVSQVIVSLTAVPNVAFLSTTTGRFDAMVFAAFRDENDLSEFVEKRIDTLSGVREHEAFVFLNIAKGRRIQYAPNNGSVDSKLITLLQKDGRQSATILSRKLGISAAQVRRRIRHLTRDGTIRIVAVVNIAKIGMRLIAITGLQIVPGKSIQVQQELAESPYIKFVAGTTGRFDVITWARFDSIEELSQFIEHDLSTINGVRSSETSMCLCVTKGSLAQI